MESYFESSQITAISAISLWSSNNSDDSWDPFTLCLAQSFKVCGWVQCEDTEALRFSGSWQMISQVAGKVEGNLWRADSRMLEVNHSWFRMLRMELEWIAWVLVQWNESNWELNIIYEVWRWIKLPDSQTVHSRTEFFTRFFHSAFGANLYRTILSRSCRKGKQKTITLLQILEAPLSFLYRKRLEAKMPAAFPRWVRMGLQKDTGQCSFSGDWTNARFTEGSPNVHWRFTEGSPGRVSWLSDAPSTNPASLLTACHSKVFVWFPHILSSISWDRDYTTQTTWKLSGPFVKHCFCEFDLKHAKPHTFTYLNLSKQRCSQCKHSIVSICFYEHWNNWKFTAWTWNRQQAMTIDWDPLNGNVHGNSIAIDLYRSMQTITNGNIAWLFSRHTKMWRLDWTG